MTYPFVFYHHKSTTPNTKRWLGYCLVACLSTSCLLISPPSMANHLTPVPPTQTAVPPAQPSHQEGISQNGINLNNSPSSTTSHTPNNSTAQTPEQFANQFNELLLSDEYSDRQSQTRWELKEPKEIELDADYEPNDDWLDFLDGMGQMVGVFGKVVLLLLLALVVWWIVKNHEAIASFIGKRLPSHRTSVTPEFEKLQKQIFEDLPEHEQLANYIADLLKQGEYLPALSLLYQGSLRVMSLNYRLMIGRSQTEEQCQALLKASVHAPMPVRAFFEELVAIWQEAAYGERLPSHPSERIGALLDKWRTLFVLADDKIASGVTDGD